MLFLSLQEIVLSRDVALQHCRASRAACERGLCKIGRYATKVPDAFQSARQIMRLLWPENDRSDDDWKAREDWLDSGYDAAIAGNFRGKLSDFSTAVFYLKP